MESVVSREKSQTGDLALLTTCKSTPWHSTMYMYMAPTLYNAVVGFLHYMSENVHAFLLVLLSQSVHWLSIFVNPQVKYFISFVIVSKTLKQLGP